MIYSGKEKLKLFLEAQKVRLTMLLLRLLELTFMISTNVALNGCLLYKSEIIFFRGINLSENVKAIICSKMSCLVGNGG